MSALYLHGLVFIEHVCYRHKSAVFYLPIWCRYYEEKGFGVILAARALNVLALGFTVVFSGFLLLSVKWSALHSECVVAGTCDIAEVCICRQCRMHHFTDMPVCQSCRYMYTAWHWARTQCRE